MFIVYALGGQTFLADKASKIPDEARMLGMVELEDSVPILDSLIDGWTNDEWTGRTGPGQGLNPRSG